MVWISLIMSFSSICIVGFFYWRFRKKHELSTERLSNRISSLLSEFNSVSSSNVKLLDDRTEELRRVVELADMKIEKLNTLIDQAESAQNILERLRDSGNGKLSGNEEHHERVLTLYEQGYEPDEIAEETGLKPGEVSVIIGLNKSAVPGADT